MPSNKRCLGCYSYKKSFRYCSICDFKICHECSQNRRVLAIDHKKRHEHTLSYICREASMTCDVCGLDDRRYFIYACHECDFVVHIECIYFPWIIKISRHEHRLAFTSSFLNEELFCGVCREKFDENYGGYSCVKGCSYVAHSKCAVYGDVWDGKELEGEPEDAYEDLTPFKKIGEGIIQHFSHNHHMKLQEANEENNRCQACTLLVYEGDIFSCMECDFVLHKACAYLPMKKQHAMHRHRLVLQNDYRETRLFCSICQRVCNGFMYGCEIGGCFFWLDMHCASVSEPLDHQCHIHPLFLPSKSGPNRICSICESKLPNSLECRECDFLLCFGCANLPKRFMYKHDEHPLIFSFEKDVKDPYWCDVCEEKINPKHGVYRCNDCNVTLHTKCLLGEEMYIIPGKILKESTLSYDEDIYNYVLLNNHLTRHICDFCLKRCEDKIFYKGFNDSICCSKSCMYLEHRRLKANKR